MVWARCPKVLRDAESVTYEVGGLFVVFKLMQKTFTSMQSSRVVFKPWFHAVLLAFWTLDKY